MNMILGNFSKNPGIALFSAWVILGSLATTAVNAQSEDEIEQDSVTKQKMAKLSTVQVSATLQPEASGDIGAPVTIVGPERLQESALTPIEALRGQPGAFVQQTTPGQSAVFVRGAKGSEVLHMVDGFRLNSTIFRNAPNQYFSLVDGQNLDRIELLRGPSAGLYGSDAMGGLVHMITRNPLDLDQESTEQTLRLRVDSGEKMNLAHYGGAVRLEDFAAQIALTSVATDGRRIGDGRRLPFSDFSSKAASARFGFDAGQAGRFGFNLQTVRQPNTPRHDELVPGFGQTQPAAEVANFEPQERQFAQFTHAVAMDWLGFDLLSWQIGSQYIIDDRRTRNLGSSNEARERNRDRLNGASLTLSQLDNAAHGFSIGAEIYRDRVHSTRINTHINSGIATIAAPRFPDAATENSLALYAIDDWRINDRWDVVFSGRYSEFDIELPAAGSTPHVELSPNAFSGHIGISYALTDTTRLVGNIGRGFRAPNVFDLGQFGDRPGNRFSIPNPDLGPETVVGSDLGIKHGDENFELEAFLYQSRFSDKIVSALTGEVTSGGRLIVQNQNAANARTYGIEAGAYWRINDKLETRMAVNLTRGTEQLDGISSAGDRMPPLTFDFALDWYANAAWRISFNALTAGRQERLSLRDLTDPRIDPDGTAGWTRFDLSSRYTLNEHVDLLARLDNIVDRNYREHGSGINAIGRNLMLGVDLQF